MPVPAIPEVETSKTPLIVKSQPEQDWVVIVGVPLELEKVRLLNIQSVLAVVGPKFSAAATFCTKVLLPVRLITPDVPVTEPLAVIFPVPIRVELALTVRSPDIVTVPLPMV